MKKWSLSILFYIKKIKLLKNGAAPIYLMPGRSHLRHGYPNLNLKLLQMILELKNSYSEVLQKPLTIT